MGRWLAVVGLLALTACGGTAVYDAPDAAACPLPVTPAEPDAGTSDASVTPNQDCLETDETIEACLVAGQVGSWTAPLACMAGTLPGRPQKRTAAGSVVERATSACCGFVVTDAGGSALCCADTANCLGAP